MQSPKPNVALLVFVMIALCRYLECKLVYIVVSLVECHHAIVDVSIWINESHKKHGFMASHHHRILANYKERRKEYSLLTLSPTFQLFLRIKKMKFCYLRNVHPMAYSMRFYHVHR